MLSKEEIENMKIGLWNIRAENLRAMQCSLADTSDKKEWQKEINTIDNALEYIDQLESDKQKLIEKLEEIIKETSQNINPEAMKKYQNLKMEEINDETYILLAMHRIGFAGEILEILKGEKLWN